MNSPTKRHSPRRTPAAPAVTAPATATTPKKIQEQHSDNQHYYCIICCSQYEKPCLKNVTSPATKAQQILQTLSKHLGLSQEESSTCWNHLIMTTDLEQLPFCEPCTQLSIQIVDYEQKISSHAPWRSEFNSFLKKLKSRPPRGPGRPSGRGRKCQCVICSQPTTATTKKKDIAQDQAQALPEQQMQSSKVKQSIFGQLDQSAFCCTTTSCQASILSLISKAEQLEGIELMLAYLIAQIQKKIVTSNRDGSDAIFQEQIAEDGQVMQGEASRFRDQVLLHLDFEGLSEYDTDQSPGRPGFHTTTPDKRKHKRRRPATATGFGLLNPIVQVKKFELNNKVPTFAKVDQSTYLRLTDDTLSRLVHGITVSNSSSGSGSGGRLPLPESPQKYHQGANVEAVLLDQTGDSSSMAMCEHLEPDLPDLEPEPEQPVPDDLPVTVTPVIDLNDVDDRDDVHTNVVIDPEDDDDIQFIEEFEDPQQDSGEEVETDNCQGEGEEDAADATEEYFFFDDWGNLGNVNPSSAGHGQVDQEEIVPDPDGPHDQEVSIVEDDEAEEVPMDMDNDNEAASDVEVEVLIARDIGHFDSDSDSEGDLDLPRVAQARKSSALTQLDAELGSDYSVSEGDSRDSELESSESDESISSSSDFEDELIRKLRSSEPNLPKRPKTKTPKVTKVPRIPGKVASFFKPIAAAPEEDVRRRRMAHGEFIIEKRKLGEYTCETCLPKEVVLNKQGIRRHVILVHLHGKKKELKLTEKKLKREQIVELRKQKRMGAKERKRARAREKFAAKATAEGREYKPRPRPRIAEADDEDDPLIIESYRIGQFRVKLISVSDGCSWKCETCEAVFKKKGSIRKHLREHEDKRVEDAKGKDPSSSAPPKIRANIYSTFKIPGCAVSFNSRPAAMLYIKEVLQRGSLQEQAEQGNLGNRNRAENTTPPGHRPSSSPAPAPALAAAPAALALNESSSSSDDLPLAQLITSSSAKSAAEPLTVHKIQKLLKRDEKLKTIENVGGGKREKGAATKKRKFGAAAATATAEELNSAAAEAAEVPTRKGRKRVAMAEVENVVVCGLVGGGNGKVGKKQPKAKKPKLDGEIGKNKKKKNSTSTDTTHTTKKRKADKLMKNSPSTPAPAPAVASSKKKQGTGSRGKVKASPRPPTSAKATVVGIGTPKTNSFKVGPFEAEQTEDGSYVCKSCDIRLSSRPGMYCHIKRDHEGRVFQCESCLGKYKSKQTLLLHMKNEHSGDAAAAANNGSSSSSPKRTPKSKSPAKGATATTPRRKSTRGATATTK